MVALLSELPVSELISISMAAQQPTREVAAASILNRMAMVIGARTQSRSCRPLLFAAANRLLTLINLPPRLRDLALKRIENARTYAMNEEYGAAVFELELQLLILGQLGKDVEVH